MKPRGFALVEILVVLVILFVLAAMALPQLRAYAVEAHILGAGRTFKTEFLKARSTAVRLGAQTAIRFEPDKDGVMNYSVYVDGNYNGVLAADIKRGIDMRLSGPFRLDAGAPGVRVGIHPNVYAPPPEGGPLETDSPIRFGRSSVVSFSPLGTATPGTFYLAGENGVQGAVRVTGSNARVRLLVSRDGRRWREEQ